MPRYIDADYLIKAIGADNSCGRCKQSRSDCLCHSLSRADICGIIDDAPTLDLAIVKPGKWIKITEDFDIDEPFVGRCSVCGWFAGIDEANVVGMNYCPNCGAKMEGASK